MTITVHFFSDVFITTSFKRVSRGERGAVGVFVCGMGGGSAVGMQW